MRKIWKTIKYAFPLWLLSFSILTTAYSWWWVMRGGNDAESSFQVGLPILAVFFVIGVRLFKRNNVFED
jgi:hypothetical protein